ncbi:MAG: 2Fe-2S iron-sulfur cluster-binding protein [Leptospirales bacterium]
MAGFFNKKKLIEVKDINGAVKAVPILPEKSAMEAIVKAKLKMEASCGGECSCSTCHVLVDPADLSRLPEPTVEEQEMIDYAYNPQHNSRLACQIKLDENLEGLKLEIAHG